MSTLYTPTQLKLFILLHTIRAFFLIQSTVRIEKSTRGDVIGRGFRLQPEYPSTSTNDDEYGANITICSILKWRRVEGHVSVPNEFVGAFVM
jgi:hypothetical protein